MVQHSIFHLSRSQGTISSDNFSGRDNRGPLDWPARQKIAVGAARGLRYLHEECRVGCIVHRDLRPNNILLTHDFEPLVFNSVLLSFYTSRAKCNTYFVSHKMT